MFSIMVLSICTFVDFVLKATQIGFKNVTNLGLTNSNFCLIQCLIWARMDRFEAPLITSSQKVDSKVLRIAIKLSILMRIK